VVVALAAEDGTKASVDNDRPRTPKACRELEQRHGLRRLEAREQSTGSRGIKPGEQRADARRLRDHGKRGEHRERGSRHPLERIVRACATGSRNEAAFVRSLREHGLQVRPRYATGGTKKVVGCSVTRRRPRGPPPPRRGAAANAVAAGLRAMCARDRPAGEDKRIRAGRRPPRRQPRNRRQ
jgi:hypothetical protein